MNNSQWLNRERAVVARAMQRANDPMYGPVIDRGHGCRVWDTAGNAYFDFTCGYSAANFGHAFEPLVDAARSQIQRLTHVTGLSHVGRIELAELLIEHCGQPGHCVLFNTSGSRAIESAIKIAVSHRPGRIVSIGPSYHGRSLATAQLSDTPSVNIERWAHLQRRPLSEAAYCARCPQGLQYPDCQLACQASLIEWLERHRTQISAILVEPAYGARGYIAPPAEVWQRLRHWTSRHGILLIADEIQMGLGRTGGWLLSKRQGWQADLVVLGKSLGGGLTPISAVIGRRELIDCLPGGCESETFAASPLATAVACEVMRQLASGPWMQRAELIGQQLANALAPHYPGIEALGGSVTIEFGGQHHPQGKRSSDQAAEEARAAAHRMVAAGVMVHHTGPFGTRIALLPPLTISDTDLKGATERLIAASVAHNPQPAR